ncbi:MAG: hypothetical protein G01um101413_336 [Parcubacteria group bacterium Gr01-1014_13]|nr:MAG: hypothetical protein G01um101413_336 [Parcubacteria group bacterium Gr01-1014_13]
MRSSYLLRWGIALVVTLFTAPAFAEDVKEPEVASPKEAPPPVKAEPVQKPYKSPVSSCGLYTNLMYLSGELNGSDRGDHFVRQGWNLGASCVYNNRSRLSIGLGAQFYLGKFLLDHEDSNLKASVSYVEMGFREWVSATLNFHDVKLTGLFGMTRTSSSGFSICSLQVNFADDWLDFKNFAKDHLTSNGELGTLEAGLDARFPFRRNFSFSFGVLWQRYSVVVHAKLDDEAKRVLEVFEYDVTKVEKDFRRTSNFFYMTPGLKWCTRGEKLCTSLVVPWGIFTADKWLWGAVLGTEYQF